MTENPQVPPGDPTPDPASGPPAYGSPSPPAYGSPPPAYGDAQPGYGQSPQFVPPGAVSEADRRTWSMLAHLGGIVLGFVAPLIVWIIYRDRDEFIKDQSAEALNFQITVTIGYVAATVLTAVLIGILLFPVVWIANLVLCIIAGMAANRGERYRYPFALRLVS